MGTLITGAGGFVGAALCGALRADGESVTAVVRPGESSWRLSDPSLAGVEIIQHDIAEPSFSKFIGDLQPSRIYHLAAHGAYSWQTDAAAIVRCNLTATIQIADAAAATGKCEAFVHTGSSSEYGLKDLPHSEFDRVMPNSVYAVTKAAATSYLAQLYRAQALRSATARLFSIYGPFEDRARLIPQVVMKGRVGKLPPLASPTIARDFVYIDDAVNGLRQIGDALARGDRPGEVFNLCSGIETTLADVADASRDVFGNVEAPDWGAYESRAWDTNKWSGNPTHTSETIGWQARIPFSEGLRLFSSWIEEHGGRERYYES